MKRRRQDLDKMVEAVLAGEPVPAGRLEPEEVEALRAAIELRAARPGADLPDEEFVTGLRRRLGAAATAGTAGPGGASPAGVPRRRVLAVAAGAVAAGVVGAVAESALSSGPTPRVAATGPVVPDRGQWVPVATMAAVGGGRVQRFATGTAVGFVTERNGAVSAVSGVCTHQGCLLQLNQAAGRLDCPCHRTAFGLDGAVVFSQLPQAPSHLPEIQVRSRGGQVEAYLPTET